MNALEKLLAQAAKPPKNKALAREELVTAIAESDKPLSDTDRKLAVEMVASGFSKAEASALFKVTTTTLAKWVEKYPEIVQQVQAALVARAVFERGRNVKMLCKIRDRAKNVSARLRAIEMLEALAGYQTEKGKEGLKIVIKGQTVNLHTERGTAVDDLILKIADAAGPGVRRLVETELVGTTYVPRRGDRAGGSGQTPSESPAPPREEKTG